MCWRQLRNIFLLHSVWSHCVKTSDGFWGHQMLSMFLWNGPWGTWWRKTYIFLIKFQNSSNQEYIRMKDYEERQWTNICWRAYSSGNNQYFLNGEIRHNFRYPFVLIPSERKRMSQHFWLAKNQTPSEEPFIIWSNFWLNLWNLTLRQKSKW